jgi:hypothetical protein
MPDRLNPRKDSAITHPQIKAQQTIVIQLLDAQSFLHQIRRIKTRGTVLVARFHCNSISYIELQWNISKKT